MGLFSLFLILGVASRVLPHPANFTIVGALLIFYAYKKDIKNSAILGLSIMLISDLILGFSFASPFVYLGFASYALVSKIYKNRFGLILAPTIAATSFFIITNFGVWLGPWYSHDLLGLQKCFTLALPFYRNTLLGDISFTLAIAAVYKIAVSINLRKANKEGEWQKLLGQMNLKRR